MRARIVAAILLLTAASGTQSIGAFDERVLTRVRGHGEEFRDLIIEGDARSQTFRAMIDEIHGSNAVVMIQFGQCAKGRFRSCVTHVAATSHTRAIHILINPQATGDRVIAMIAHELQHALEIIRTPEATDAESVMALYRRIGKGECAKGRSDRCETEAALAVERTVLDELDRSPRGR